MSTLVQNLATKMKNGVVKFINLPPKTINQIEIIAYII